MSRYNVIKNKIKYLIMNKEAQENEQKNESIEFDMYEEEETKPEPHIDETDKKKGTTGSKSDFIERGQQEYMQKKQKKQEEEGGTEKYPELDSNKNLTDAVNSLQEISKNVPQQNQISKADPKLNKTPTSNSKDSSKNNSLLICIQDSEVIPTVFLQPSPKGCKFISIKVPMYRTTTFMKMQTQIFILDVSKPGTLRDYQIQRRYSDFVQLYEALFYNHPGYILAPFPEKGIQSFVKIKFGLGTQQPGERCELIEKRMLELQKFINYVTHHRELCNSEQLATFITQDHLVYEEGKKRLQKYVSENKSFEKGSQFKNIIGFGKSLWNSYMKNQTKPKEVQMTIGKNDIQFGVIFQTVKTEKQRTKEKQGQCEQIYKAQRSFSEFVDMSTENDILLKLCSKHTSGKQYCKAFADFIEINVLDPYRYNIRKFGQIEKSLAYRLQIWQCHQQAKAEGNLEKRQKLARRLEMFERNFLNDWENIFVEIEKSNRLIHQNFVKEWKTHKKLMKKIWKSSNKNN